MYYGKSKSNKNIKSPKHAKKSTLNQKITEVEELFEALDTKLKKYVIFESIDWKIVE